VKIEIPRAFSDIPGISIEKISDRTVQKFHS